jgi:type VI protein secretion system component Hcp
MAVDMFLKIDGVTGEAKDKVHGKEIDVLSWSWGMGNHGSAHVLGGAGQGKNQITAPNPLVCGMVTKESELVTFATSIERITSGYE